MMNFNLSFKKGLTYGKVTEDSLIDPSSLKIELSPKASRLGRIIRENLNCLSFLAVFALHLMWCNHITKK